MFYTFIIYTYPSQLLYAFYHFKHDYLQDSSLSCHKGILRLLSLMLEKIESLFL
jgi:hypothetical protein